MPPGGPPLRTGGPSASAFLSKLRAALGTPYVWGGAAPGGFDCSGLVQWALQSVGLRNVPRTSEAQWGWVQRISQAQLQPGDLIFEQWPGDGPAPGHVAIYTGRGKIEEAPQPGEPVHEVPWSPGSVSAAGGRVIGYGRIPGLSGLGAPIGLGGGGGGILSWPSEISGAFGKAGTALDWFLQPNHWVRIWAGLGGGAAVLSGVWMMSHVGGDMAGGVGVPRAASLPLGILLVGGGSVLLFVAFHNLPANVQNFPDLIGYLVGSIRGNVTGTPSPSGASGGGAPSDAAAAGTLPVPGSELLPLLGNTGPGPNVPGLPGVPIP